MWWTPEGFRTLREAEAALVRESLALVFELVEDEDSWDFGVPGFDRLEQEQKLAILAQAGSALLRADVPAPRLTAPLEAAVAVIYQEIGTLIRMEIDQKGPPGEGGTARRQLVRQARRDADEPPDARSTDADAWDDLIAGLTGRVLWDDDWAEPGGCQVRLNKHEA